MGVSARPRPSEVRDGGKLISRYDDEGERLALEDLHDKILIMVDDLVEEYVNTDTLCAHPGEDWFPVQTRLTGEFYICSESYDRLPGESWI